MQSGHAGSAIAPVVCAGVGVRYGSLWPVRLASFRLAPSDLGTAALGIAVTQPAARATLIDVLSGRVAPRYGSLAVLGHDMRTADGRASAKRQVGIAGLTARAGGYGGSLRAGTILPAIRIRGLVERAARLSGQPASDRHLLVAAIIDRLALSPWAGVQLRAAPEIVARKACIAAACVHQPKLLLVDGLLDRLGIRDQALLADVIAGLRGELALIVLGTDADVLSLATDRVLTMANSVVTDRDCPVTAPLPADTFASSLCPAARTAGPRNVSGIATRSGCRRLRHMDWNLYRCGRAGHITYAPDEPAINEQLHARTVAGDLWQCARCGTYVPGPPQASGPVAKAPVVRRGKEIRSEIILRLFAIERFIRFVLFAAVAYGIFRFGQSQTSIENAFNHDLPIFRNLFHQLGYNIDHSSIVGLFRRALQLKPTTLHLLAAGLAAFAVVELVEGLGLWLAKRWGEYFAAAVTAVGLPYEVYDLTAKVTATRIVLFILNLALVLYLILTKRLFGARGGRPAYELRLRGESIFEAATAAAVATSPAGPAGTVGTAGPVGTAGSAVIAAHAADPWIAEQSAPARVSPAGPVRPTDPTMPMTSPDP